MSRTAVYVQRVAALAGDRVELRGSSVYVNDAPAFPEVARPDDRPSCPAGRPTSSRRA